MADTKRIDIYNYDPGAKKHSGKNTEREGSGSKYTSVEGDDHEDPSTGSAMIFYPSRGQ
jgi:hypothetical protein